MKIAHINFLPSDGVYKKILGQARAASQLGLDIDFIVFTNQSNPPVEKVILFPLKILNNRIKKKIFFNSFRYHYILKYIDLSIYEYIVLRYPGIYDFDSLSFFRRLHGKVITEHQSIYLKELTLQKKEGLLNLLRIKREKKNAPKVLSHVAGLIGVTNEVRLYYSNLLDASKPSINIHNGIDVSRTSFTKNIPFDGYTLNLIFVADEFFSWHGLDRVLSGLQSYSGKVEVNLFLCGSVKEKKELNLIRDTKKERINIHLIGPVTSQNLDHYFMNSHLAISSLALHRIHQNETSALKTREYCARGIPFILAYEDSDLGESCDFTLKISAEDKPLDMTKVIHFAEEVGKIKGLSLKMRTFAENKLDWKIKITEMYNFVSKI